MKKLMVFAVAAIFVFGMFLGFAESSAYAKEYKMGYVDLAKVFDEYKKTKDSEKNLDEQAKAKEAVRKGMVDELRKMKDEQALLSDKAKAEKQAAIDAKLKILQDFDRKTRDDLLKQRNDLLGGIMKDIDKVVADYAKENGYDLVLNYRMLLYGAPQYDMTTEVLNRLNK